MVVVTGATGLVGSHLLYELARKGERIRALRREGSDLEFVRRIFSLYSDSPQALLDSIEWVEADLSDYRSLLAALNGARTVFHTAAYVSFNPRDESKILSTNVLGTANLVDAALECGVSALVHISSVAALGLPNPDGTVDEECTTVELKGESAYARSKFLGENEVWRAHQSGLRVVIVNPSVILGPGRWSSGSGQLIARVASGMPFYTDGVTGFVDVRDVARATVRLWENPEINGERFVLNADNLTYRDFFGRVAEALGRPKPRFRIPALVVDILYPLIWLFGLITGRGSAISKKNLKSAFTKTYYSSARIQQRIGFRFIPISETIGFVARCYRNG